MSADKATPGSTSRPALDELASGQFYEREVTLTEERLRQFVELSGDSAPAHVDLAHAQALGFRDRIVHGFLVAVPYSAMLGMHLPGGNTVIQKLQLDMVAPVFVGDTLTYRVAVERIVPAVKAVVLSLSAHNDRGELVSRGSATCVFRV